MLWICFITKRRSTPLRQRKGTGMHGFICWSVKYRCRPTLLVQWHSPKWDLIPYVVHYVWPGWTLVESSAPHRELDGVWDFLLTTLETSGFQVQEFYNRMHCGKVERDVHKTCYSLNRRLLRRHRRKYPLIWRLTDGRTHTRTHTHTHTHGCLCVRCATIRVSERERERERNTHWHYLSQQRN
jgi:hypothetical protein